MKISQIYSKFFTLIFLVSLPFMISCSVLGGNSYSNNPAVEAQQQRVDALKSELKIAERTADEAEQRAKAAKNRLKAAEHELKALKSQAKSSGS
jgi:chromosome segregation ATPase